MRTSAVSACLFASACALFACSSNDANGFGDAGDSDATVDGSDDALSLPPPTTDDAGPLGDDDASPPVTGDDDTTGDDSGVTGDDDSGSAGDDDSGSTPIDGGHDAGPADCGATVSFHPADGGVGPYCPFSSTDGGRDFACAAGQHCCQPATGTSSCQADCTGAPDGGTDWQCDDTSQCGGGNVCCAITSGTGQDQGCSFVFLHHFTGTVCAAACGVGQIPVCEGLGECTTGTCTPTRAKGSDFGTCD